MFDIQSLYNNIQKHAEQNRIFAEFATEHVNYRDFLTLIQKTLHLLRSYHLNLEDRIIIVSKDDKMNIVLFVSCLIAGICPVILSVETKLEKLFFLVQQTDASLCFIDDDIVIDKLTPITQVIFINNNKKNAFIHKILGGKQPLEGTYPSILTTATKIEPVQPIAPNQLAYILYTSGSTANPKGVMITHKNLFAHLSTLQTVFGYDNESIIFNNLPLSHADGMIHGPLIALLCGAKLVRTESFTIQSIDPFLNIISKQKVSHFIATPTLLNIINKYASYTDYFNIPNFKMLISTASRLDKYLWSTFQTRFSVKIYNVYGLTETVNGGIFCGPDISTYKIGSIGKPVDMRSRIIDEFGADVQVGEIGELLLQGDNVTPGYFKNQIATQSAFKDQWFYTGDLAKIDEDGFIEIVGRKKEAIVSAGFLIYPDEIVEVLKSHPLVKDVAVIGFQNEIGEEIPIAFLELLSSINEAELSQYCNQYLDNSKIPRHFLFVDSIPKGAVGKPILSELQVMANEKFTAKKNLQISEEHLLTIASKVFNVPKDSLTLHSGISEIFSWDSLGHMSLIQAVEHAFNLRFTGRDVMQFTTLRDVYHGAIKSMG